MNKELCERYYKKIAFDFIGNYRSNSNGFFKHLNQKIYRPLGYTIKKDQDISKIIMTLTEINDGTSMFEGKPLMTDYKTFEENIKN